MSIALIDRDKAADYEVQADDTLESIIKDQCPEIDDWRILARYNWGTDQPREVLRALIETIGVKTADLASPSLLANPQEIALAPDPDDSPKLIIPKIWKEENLALEKTHTITVRQLPKPPTAIYIDTLDKWFIPEVEECAIEYGLEGDGECADTVQLDVFGSNYCECTDWNRGLGTYADPADLEDTPVFTKDLSTQAEERTGYGMPTGKPWKGESTAAAGILSRKTGMAAQRHINAAFSPYTVHFRYWKKSAGGDAKARLVLKPFWPQWEENKSTPGTTPVVEPGQIKVQWTNTAKADRGVLEIRDKNGQLVHLAAIPADKLTAAAQEIIWNKNYRPDAENSKFGKVYLDDSATAPNNENAPYSYVITSFVRKAIDESLKIAWEIKDTGKLKHGLLQIIDASDKLVFHKPLDEALVDENEHDFQWDGKYAEGITNSKGGDEIIPEDMPYRVHIQAHTGVGEAEGLALAAMHTEVRLYVRPETAAPKDLIYDPYLRAKQSMLLSLGPLFPGDPPAEGSGTKWYRYKLAQYGFHPGPVTDAAAADGDYHIALKEFKRSVPKEGNVAAPNFSRMDVNVQEAEALTAIKTIRESDKRKLFGSLTRVQANSNTPDLTDNEVKSDIRDPNVDMIVWADDRQYYTQGTGKDENNQEYLSGLPDAIRFGLHNYRGDMGALDGRTDTDAASIPRPWIPLKTSLRLLSRAKGLYDEADVVVNPAIEQAMRHAIGPLRVDWTFDELPRDVSMIVSAPPYNNDYVRSRYYVAWAIDQKKATYDRKDTGRKATYTNCRGGASPNDLGGIRPDDGDLSTYYQKAFGYDDLSLSPWRATAVASTESIATVIHDHLAASQKDYPTDLYAALIGAAGAYFHPSRIAGDGYRVRAEVQFEKFGGYEFPNLEVLKGRYPAPPQAHTARLRTWRRSSIRGNLCWAPNASGHWPAFLTAFRNNYRAAHVYFVFENEANKVFNITDLFDPNTRAHRDRYKNVIKNNVDPLKNPLRDTGKMSLHREHLWPWVHDGSIWPYESTVNLAAADACDHLDTAGTTAWRDFRYALLYAALKEIEKQGYLRGHLFAEFRSSPEYYAEEYQCNGGVTSHRYWYYREKGVAHGGLNGQKCPGPFCNGHGALSPRGRLATTGRRREPGSNPKVISLPAVGVALGATWLWDDNACTTETWTHEVGHHRHMEHAANGPGAELADSTPHANAKIHDNQDNTKIANWGALGVVKASEQKWDRRCTMSYNKDAPRYYCGKCILRNRGWKVRDLGFPGTDKTET